MGEAYVSTTQVAQALGVSVTTVKRWVDEGILPAHRTPGGHRKLLLADVKRLAREGHLPQADLGSLDAQFVTAPTRQPQDLQSALLDAIQAGRGDQVRVVIRGAYDGGMPIEELADQVISPVMIHVGHAWEIGKLDVLHEHRGMQLIKSALYELKGEIESHAERDRPVAIGGAPEGDFYILPSLLAEMALLDAGWQAVNIGPNTPMSSFVRAIQEYRPRLLWLSASQILDPEGFVQEYRAMSHAAMAANVAIAIGGRGLEADLRAKIPYTTHGDGFKQLIAFARTLHPRPRLPRRGRPPVTP